MKMVDQDLLQRIREALQILLGKRRDTSAAEVEVANWQLEKKDKETGEVFEVLEGGFNIPTVCTKRVLGLAPAESYALEIPLEGEL